MTLAMGIALCAAALLLGLLLARFLGEKPQGATAEHERQRLLESARSEAEQLKRDAQVQAKEIVLSAQEAADGDLRERRTEMAREAERLTKLEETQERKASALATHEEEFNRRERNIANREQATEFRRAKSELKATFETHLNELEKETRVATTTVPTVVDPSSSRYSYPYDEYGAYDSGSSPEIAASTSVVPVPMLEQPAAESSEAYREPAIVAHALPITDTVVPASSTLEQEHRS